MMTLQTFDIADAFAICPNCLTTKKLRIERTPDSNHALRFFVICGCALQGPPRRTLELAVAAWNVATSQPIAPRIGCDCTAAPELTTLELTYVLKLQK